MGPFAKRQQWIFLQREVVRPLIAENSLTCMSTQQRNPVAAIAKTKPREALELAGASMIGGFDARYSALRRCTLRIEARKVAIDDAFAAANEQSLLVILGGVAHLAAPQSSGGISVSGTTTSTERDRPGVRLIKPRRSRVRIMLCTDGGVTSK